MPKADTPADPTVQEIIASEPEKAPLVVEILRKYFPQIAEGAEELFHDIGEVVELPFKEARKIVNLGIAKLHDAD